MTTNQENTEGWEILQQGIDKLIKTLEEQPDEPQLISSDEIFKLYRTTCNMCTQEPPHDCSQQLYDKYRGVFVDYIKSTVMPCLRKTSGENMLRELVKRWRNHNVMVCKLSIIFLHLDLHFVQTRSLPTLIEVAGTCFIDLVFGEMNEKVRDAVFSLIDREKEGGEIDRALLKNVQDILVDIDGHNTANHSRKALEDSVMNLTLGQDV